MTDRRPLTLRTDVAPNRLQEMPAGDLLPPDTLANALFVVLQGLVTNTSAGITPTDTVLQAMGKLQAQTDSLANATGQALATMSGQVSNKVDKDGSKVLTDNNFTNTERVKLANIGDGASNDRGKHTGTQSASTITGLGTAAARNVVGNTVGFGPGVLTTGTYGIGADIPAVYPDYAGDLSAWGPYTQRCRGSGFSNAPTNDWLMADHWAHDESYATQEARSFTFTIPKRWHRNKAAGTWYPWQMFYDTANAVADVTGTGLMDSGSNGNGQFVRFKNGLMVCISNTLIFSGSASDPAGSIRSLEWVFPASFVADPIVSACATAYGAACEFIGNDGSSATTGTSIPKASVRLMASGVGPFPMKLQAVGFWKSLS